MVRTASQVDRSELSLDVWRDAVDRDLNEIRQDVADIISGETRRDDRLKTDTQQSMSAAANMMEAQRQSLVLQGKTLEKHGEILEDLREASLASAKERENRKGREKREGRKFWLAIGGLLVPIVLAAIYAIGHVSEPPKVETGEHAEPHHP